MYFYCINVSPLFLLFSSPSLLILATIYNLLLQTFFNTFFNYIYFITFSFDIMAQLFLTWSACAGSYSHLTFVLNQSTRTSIKLKGSVKHFFANLNLFFPYLRMSRYSSWHKYTIRTRRKLETRIFSCLRTYASSVVVKIK